MPHRLRAVAFDLDAASLVSLRGALPGWAVEVVNGATAASLTRGWDPGAADLLVVRARDEVEETLGLCRFLVFCGVFAADARGEREGCPGPPGNRRDEERPAHPPLLVLVPPGQQSLVKAVFAAGADRCLEFPVHTEEVARVLTRLGQGERRPGLDRGCEDRWQDDGGQQ
jgi:hypothetical protein